MSDAKRRKGDGGNPPDAAAHEGADDPEQPENEEAGASQQHENDSNRDGDVAADAEDNPAAARNANTRIGELKSIQQHFSKIAQQFVLHPTRAAYSDWAVQFEAELASHDLDHVLTDDPETAEQQWSDGSPDLRVAQQEQKTVYNMIVRCVDTPQLRTVVITARPLSERTGFHVWRALRSNFIGDEQTYKLSLESEFEAFRWGAAESWATMETSFEALLAQLAAVGVHKEPHQKIARIMAAIQQAGRHDAQGGSVYTRLHTTNRIKDSLGYPVWITAMRTEAQMIQDELAKRGAKRPRDEHEADERDRQSVSFVGQTAHDGPASAATSSSFTPRYGDQQIVCRNMRDRGFCNFGKQCRFSHDVQPGGRNRNFRNNFSNSSSSRSQGGNSSYRGQGGMNGGRNSSNNGQGGRSQGGNRNGPAGVCYEYAATGRCSRADCRFTHAAAAAGAGPKQESGSGGYKKEVQFAQFAQVFSVQTEQAVFKENQGGPAVPHRVLVDSCASVDLTPRRDFIPDLRPLKVPVSIRGALGKIAMATLGGDGHIPVGNGEVLFVPAMVYCEQLHDTLLSQVKLYEQGHTLNLGRDEGMFIAESQRFAIPISYRGNIFTLMLDTTDEQQTPAIPNTAEAHAATRSMSARETPAEEKADTAEPASAAETSIAATLIPASSIRAHALYGHLCGRKLDQLIEHEAAEGLTIHKKHPSHKLLIANCDACMKAKMKRTVFGKEMRHLAAAPNDEVVADSIGPITAKRRRRTGPR